MAWYIFPPDIVRRSILSIWAKCWGSTFFLYFGGWGGGGILDCAFFSVPYWNRIVIKYLSIFLSAVAQQRGPGAHANRIRDLPCGLAGCHTPNLAKSKAVSETTNRQIESVNRERESVATQLFFGIHYRISLSTITFEFRTISVSVSPLIFLQRYRSSLIEIER